MKTVAPSYVLIKPSINQDNTP